MSIRFVVSVRSSAWNNWAPTGWIFVKFEVSLFFEILSKRLKFH